MFFRGTHLSIVLLASAATLLTAPAARVPAQQPIDAPAAGAGSYDWAKWREFWSFKPVAKPAPPAVNNAAWVRGPIDAFVLARLESAGLRPSPQADKSTLIRRATYDLLGLPPTAAETRAFLADASDNAYENLIDRLLASPHYGEKWGRHWLDVARYTPGRISFAGVKHSQGDSAYRDYVVRAFNSDKPFDHFVTEQLAGDLLPPAHDRQQEYDQITAPAFLSIGPWFDMCTDPNRLRLEMVDDMVAVTGKAFLGLSINCARCHDHKFDPIPTADYYALAGIFQSTRLVGDFSEYWRDGRVRLLRPLAMPDEVAANQRIRDQVEAKKRERWNFLRDRHAELLALWKKDEARYRAAARELAAPFVYRFEAEDHDGIYNLRVGELSRDGKVVQVIETLNPAYQWVKYKFEVPQDGAYRLESLFSADEKSPVTVNVNGLPPIQSALDSATGGWDLAHQRWGTVATFELRQGLNFLRLERKQGDFPRIDKFRLTLADDALDSRIHRVADGKKLNPLLLADFVVDPENPWPTVAGVEPYLTADERATADTTARAINSLSAALQPHEMIVSVSDQPRPADMPIHPRGAVESAEKEMIPRNVPRLFDSIIPRRAISQGNSGRLELARWITDPRNPLTARVIVNRVWQWHFGRGIVDTSSDFGSRGSPPTNPQLLDWLAAQFVEEGWSLKKLNRDILLSSTYRMSGKTNESAQKVDPDDRLLWRFAPRRLEAEELFDSMFSSTNVLVHQTSGKPLDLEKSKGRALYVLTSNRAPPGLGPEVRKMFGLFDFDMSGASIDRRPESNTAAQSLFWLNSPLARFYAEKFADRLLKMEKLSDEKRLEQAYWIALGHAPDRSITEITLSYLNQRVAQGETPRQAWAQVCQAIYASDEFHYVR